MQLGIVGLGRMGGNIARRLMLNGHTTVVYDRNTDFVDALTAEGATGVADLAAPRPWRPKAWNTSTSAPPAASGAWSAATA